MKSGARIIAGALIVILVSTLGLALKTNNWSYPFTNLWPIAGLWVAIAWSGSFMSVRAASTLVLLGFYQDYLHEAPLGAWPLAYLLAYMAGLGAYKLFPARSDQGIAEAFGLVTGLMVALLGVVMAGAMSDVKGVFSRNLLADFVLTGMLYYPLRPLFTRGGRLEEVL